MRGHGWAATLFDPTNPNYELQLAPFFARSVVVVPAILKLVFGFWCCVCACVFVSVIVIIVQIRAGRAISMRARPLLIMIGLVSSLTCRSALHLL